MPNAQLYGFTQALTRRSPMDIVRVYLSGRADWKFDRRHGIETEIPDMLTTHDLMGNNGRSATLYRGVRSGPFAEFLRQSALNPQLTFVDYGCGKGRAMILAAEYGFKDVKGLEFSRQLVEQTRQNLEIVQDKFKTRFSVLHTDVIDYVPTAQDHVFYFYDPFDDAILRRCFENIDRSFREHPRPQFVIYHNNLVHDMDGILNTQAWSTYRRYTIQGNNFFLLSRQGSEK
jgi:SAM-dependent methyltransferase